MSPKSTVPDTRLQIDLLEDLIELMPLATLAMDENGSILFGNSRVTELLGWGKDHFPGKKLATLVPQQFREAFEMYFGRCLRSPEHRLPLEGLQLWVLQKDAADLPVELVLRPMTGLEDTVILATLRDLSNRRRAKDELRASERRYRLAASHTADIIQEVNLAEDRMVYVGDVDRLFGYRPGEFPRTLSGLVEFVHPDDLEIFESAVEEFAKKGRQDWSVKYRVRAADGTYRHIHDQGTMTGFLPDGSPNEGVGAFQDITERVVKEQELQKVLAELQAARDQLTEENIYLREQLQEELAHSDIVGESGPWRHVMAQVQLVAGTDSTVLISGETGTGKELLARALHAESALSGRPLIKVNCAALPGTLIESELFGHEKGAFSGADRLRKGRFELADRGTLFLDEVAELPVELQAKLLQVLQTGEFERLGSSKTLQCDVRVIAATNRNLKESVDAGRFRSDLYYRLAVFPIEVPPLRRRRDDIPLLAMYFLARQNTKHRKSIETISKAGMEALTEYRWPGNVRELGNLIERAVVVSMGSSLDLDIGALSSTPGALGRSRGPESALSREAPSAPAGTRPSTSLQDVERAHILAVLESCDWKVKGRGNAAEQLGLKESTLRARMKKLGIKRPAR